MRIISFPTTGVYAVDENSRFRIVVFKIEGDYKICVKKLIDFENLTLEYAADANGAFQYSYSYI